MKSVETPKKGWEKVTHEHEGVVKVFEVDDKSQGMLQFFTSNMMLSTN